ncbi:MAG: cysteine dioxygenase [Pseudomonadota bacterium]|nr:cysteine dioxygenase [Pseudomonadota bacterium]
MHNISRLRRFVTGMTDLANVSDGDEQAMVSGSKILLADLIAKDNWLPGEYAAEGDTYRQYLLHCDPNQRFSVVSFVWGPGQTTPVHDHTVWGLVGMLRGAETGQRFDVADDGSLFPIATDLLEPGDIDIVSPALGDIHKVSNAFDDQTSISIHVYGANIGAVNRHVYDLASGNRTSFISGYSNTEVPNLWDLSLL